jgi:hypothetical protein
MPKETPGNAEWAKAPDYSDDPAKGAALRAATEADRQEFLSSGLRPLACESCGTRVLVRKTSRRQTSIQWTTDAATSCPVFAERRAALKSANGSSNGHPAPAPMLMDTCERLRSSIEQAVRDGLLEVPDA